MTARTITRLRRSMPMLVAWSMLLPVQPCMGQDDPQKPLVRLTYHGNEDCSVLRGACDSELPDFGF